jgi:hypothetical protein
MISLRRHCATQAQIVELNRASALPEPERVKLKNGVLELVLPMNGLALVEISSK